MSGWELTTNIAGSLLALVLLGYLFAALVRPERF